MSAREGFWMSTHTGKRVYPLDLRPDDFCIEDIAHGLSNVCRYAGQCASFYSVAEHCERGSRHAEQPELQREFLMHDAAEAYLGDAVRPMAELLNDYRLLRDRMQECINRKFGLGWPISAACDEIDERMLITEAPRMFLHEDKWWRQPRFPQPYAEEWIAMRGKSRVGEVKAGEMSVTDNNALWDVQFRPPRMAKRLFLERFKELFQ